MLHALSNKKVHILGNGNREYAVSHLRTTAAHKVFLFTHFLSVDWADDEDFPSIREDILTVGVEI